MRKSLVATATPCLRKVGYILQVRYVPSLDGVPCLITCKRTVNVIIINEFESSVILVACQYCQITWLRNAHGNLHLGVLVSSRRSNYILLLHTT